MLLPLALTLYSRQWKYAYPISLGFILTLLTTRSISLAQKLILAPHTLPSSGVTGIYDVLVFVPDLDVRLRALHVALFLSPTIIGVVYAFRESLIADKYSGFKNAVEVGRVMLLGFVGSWLTWYIFSSNGHPRYAFPPSFVGSIFVGKLLSDLMDKEFKVFSWRKVALSPAVEFLNQHLHPERLLAMLLIGFWAIPTTRMLHQAYFFGADRSAVKAANFMNTQTPHDAVIETYDSEIQFLLNRRYHFPPDQIIVDLIRRAIVGPKQKVPIEYDPLLANPDYLVVGEFIKGLRLYDPVIRTGAFRLVKSFNEYDIYQRSR